MRNSSRLLSNIRLIFLAGPHFGLLVDKEARLTTRIDHDVRTILMREKMSVNSETRIGNILRIEVGDQFNYKSELSLIGLHFRLMSGIDNKEKKKLNTGLEGTEYIDIFKYDGLINSRKGQEAHDQNLRVNFKVGDKFDYQTELTLVGIHFGMMSGINYKETRPGLFLATSIVASEGSEYNNIFKSGQLIYSGVGNDQNLVRGNIALVDSMK
ncbi:BnaC02g46910D [Brassica napus]|uniref:BnaC02g46910D protein n=5 Tax=Brassica TaxID=3705 RepID=A0A078IP22_BRANA|nr:BnaC02g46910D [Brassica napus]